MRLSRAMLKKSPSSESGPAAETGILQRLLYPDPVSQPTTHTRSNSSQTAKTTTPPTTAFPEESATAAAKATATATATATAAAPAAATSKATSTSTAIARTLTALLLGVLLFISPLYCFTSHRQPTPIYILTGLAFAVFGFYKISKGELKLIRSPLDTAVFLLPGLALLSGVGAWDTGEAVNLALLLSCCAALYWIVSSVVDSLEAIHAILALITASAAAAAVLCLPAVFQQSTSYPNAAALGALSVAALLITFYLRTACQRDKPNCQSSRTAFQNWAAALHRKATQNNITTLSDRTASQEDAALQTNTAATQNTTTFQSSTVTQNTPTPQNNIITFQTSTASQYKTTDNSWLHPALSAAGYLILLIITGINSPLLYLILISGIPFFLWMLQGSCPGGMSDTGHPVTESSPDSISRNGTAPFASFVPLAPMERRPTGELIKDLAHFIIYASIAFLVAGKVRLCLQSGADTAGWVWAAIGLLLVLALEYSLIIYQRSGRRLKPWVLPAAFVLLTVLLLTSSTAYLRSTPSDAANQPARHDARYYIEEKLLKGRDALRIMASSPRTILQGTGGGGWEPLLYQHQSFYYQDSPPGAFLQTGVEMGLPGLITLLALWILFFKVIKGTTAQSALAEELNGTARAKRAARTIGTDGAAGIAGTTGTAGTTKTAGATWATRAERAPWTTSTAWPSSAPGATKAAAWPVLTAALAIGCCSLWHCTLSMSAVSLVLFTLFGLGQALDNFSIRLSLSPGDPDSPGGRIQPHSAMPKRPRSARTKKLLQYLTIGGATLIVVTISLNIYAGESSAITASQALKKGDIMAAITNYEKAVEKNPLNASYRKELGKLYLENEAQSAMGATNAKNAQGTTPPTRTKLQSLKLATHHFQKAVHLARGDAELRVLYAGTLFQSGHPEEGVRHLETAVLLRPLEQQFYEDLALGYVTAAHLLLNEPTREESAQKEPTRDKPTHDEPTPDVPTRPDEPARGVPIRQNEPTRQDESTPKEANSKATAKERKERAHTYLFRAMGIPQLLEKRSAQIDKRHLRYWSGAPYLGITPKIQLCCGQAAVLLGDRKAALHYLEQAAQDASLKEEAELWQNLVLAND